MLRRSAALVLALLFGTGCAEDFSTAVDLREGNPLARPLSPSKHRLVIFNDELPHTLDRIIDDCAPLPFTLNSSAPALDLRRRCSDAQAAQLVIDNSYADPSKKALYESLFNGLSLTFPVGAVLPAKLESGVHTSIYKRVIDIRNSYGTLWFGCEANGSAVLKAQSSPVLEHIGVGWGREPSLSTRLFFKDDLRVARLQIGGYISCSGEVEPIIRNYLGQSYGYMLAIMNGQIPRGTYDFTIGEMNIDVDLNIGVEAKEITITPHAEVHIESMTMSPAMKTVDGTYSLDDVLGWSGTSVRGMEAEIAASIEQRLSAGNLPNDFKTFLDSTIKSGHQVCDIEMPSANQPNAGRVVVHTALKGESCTKPREWHFPQFAELPPIRLKPVITQ